MNNQSFDLCCADDSERRRRARRAPLNGFDYLEVEQHAEVDDEGERVIRLRVAFLGRAPTWPITPEHLRIEGGLRIRDIRVIGVEVQRSEREELDDLLLVRVQPEGDFSEYCLRIIGLDEREQPTGRPPTDFDPRYASVRFTFNQFHPSPLDCLAPDPCIEEPQTEPAIDYLAKDYGSFRRLMLDRLALLLPDWQERHVPDLGITLVELLAHVGDQLSYFQDAVATEAYLDTARQRISVRRHARLVDYTLHEGCNARTWVTVEVSERLVIKAGDFFFATAAGQEQEARVVLLAELDREPTGSYEVFEPLQPGGDADIVFWQEHNRIDFYTWGGRECCLPKGATAATLVDPGIWLAEDVRHGKEHHHRESEGHCVPGAERPGSQVPAADLYRLQLVAGDVLILEEVLGPRTGDPADADPAHRHAVRLTRVERTFDPLDRQLLLNVEWCVEDALPFPLCLSSISQAPDCGALLNVSVARGNVVLVDHGRTVEDDLEEAVPVARRIERCADGCTAAEVTLVPGRYRPTLPRLDVTFAEPVREVVGVQACGSLAAVRALRQEPRRALPQVGLTSTLQSREKSWVVRQDLLGSTATERHFVVEVDDRRQAHLRFGDGDCGSHPDAGEQFHARYRVGNGPAGNVGADSIRRIVFKRESPPDMQMRPRNPLPAVGGQAPESVQEAKLRAPHAFRTRLERAITAADYAAIVQRDFAATVQRAAAKLEQEANGPCVKVRVAIDPLGRTDAPDQLLEAVENHLERYRRIGHHVVVEQAVQVSIELGLEIQVKAGYLRAHVEAAVRDVLGNRVLRGGNLGFFHPDRLTFGEGIHVSRIVAVVQAVEGVEYVVVMTLKRFGEALGDAIEQGVLPMGPMEIARLDNDPNFLEHGTLTLQMGGGR